MTGYHICLQCEPLSVGTSKNANQLSCKTFGDITSES